jgi:hypothetical protein
MNVGFYSLQSAALGCSVDAFEIQPRMHQLINLSLSLNPGLADRIRPHALAVTVDARHGRGRRRSRNRLVSHQREAASET